MKGAIICLVLCVCSVQGYYNQMQASNTRQYTSNNFMNHRYSNFNNNNINNNNGYQRRSNMGYLPFLFGDEGRQLAGYSMMLNSNGNNMVLPYLMNGGESSSVLPMMAFMNRGGRRMNPFVMSMLMEQEV